MKDKTYERYYLKNREKIVAKMKEYNKKNREKLSEYMREYRKNNKDKLKTYYSKYFQKNKKTKRDIEFEQLEKDIESKYGVVNKDKYLKIDNLEKLDIENLQKDILKEMDLKIKNVIRLEINKIIKEEIEEINEIEKEGKDLTLLKKEINEIIDDKIRWIMLEQDINKKYNPQTKSEINLIQLGEEVKETIKKKILKIKREIDEEKSTETIIEKYFKYNKNNDTENNDLLIEECLYNKYHNKQDIKKREKQINLRHKIRMETFRLKSQVFEHYGGKCSCCGESQFEFLSIDHINNNGSEHRKDIKKSGTHFYKWIIDNNYPDDLQILCLNCNLSKGFYGYCAHDEKNLKKNRYRYYKGL